MGKEQQPTIDELDKIFSFMFELFPLNSTLRFGGAPHMSDLASQDQMDRFIENHGQFETVPGHIVSMLALSKYLLECCPNLNLLLVRRKVYEVCFLHDLGEAKSGDVSAAKQVLGQAEGSKEKEREGLKELASILPGKLGDYLLATFDKFELNIKQPPSLEVLFTRFIDDFQAGFYLIRFGKNFEENALLIEKIIKERVALRAFQLTNALDEMGNAQDDDSYYKAEAEVYAIANYHFKRLRDAGIKLDLSEFGF